MKKRNINLICATVILIILSAPVYHSFVANKSINTVISGLDILLKNQENVSSKLDEKELVFSEKELNYLISSHKLSIEERHAQMTLLNWVKSNNNRTMVYNLTVLVSLFVFGLIKLK